jgi:hypothetical protein
MAVLVIFSGEGFTQPMYQSLRSEVQWETNLAPGGLVHACGFDDAGNLHVADVWESAERMNEFVGGRLIPALNKLGIPIPTVSVFPAYNVNVYPEAKRFLLK